MGIYHKVLPNRVLIRAILGCLMLGTTVICFFTTYAANVGALPFAILPVAENDPNQVNYVNFDYLNMVYMKPWFHLNTYIFGIILALVYMRHLTELRENNREDAENIEINYSSRLFVFVNSNNKIRYGGYILGMLMLGAAFGWLYPFYSNALNQSQISCAFFAAFANLLIVVGFALILMPALKGKSAFFSEIFGCGLFLSLSNLSAMMATIGPIVCLWFFLSTGHPLDFSYYVQQYYFDSNAFFTFLISVLLALLSDKPFNSIINLKKDCADVNRDENKNSIIGLKNSTLNQLYQSVSN